MVQLVLILLGLLGNCYCAEWYTALVSNVDDDTFYYYSDVWFNSTPFNTDKIDTENALLEAYSTVYVDQLRITMDGTLDQSCGSSCVLTFSLPSTHAGYYTLMDLVTADGGLELSDDRMKEWKNTDANYFSFQGSSYYDKYYCSNFGLNYGNYDRAWDRYQQIARARIGVTLNYYQPVGGMRAAEGIGLTYGYSRQWTDNVGSGRVEYYSSYLFRPAKVEVFGSTIKAGKRDSTFSPAKVNGNSKYPVQFTAFNSTLQSTLIPKNTFVMMFRLKRETQYITNQVFRVGTSRYLSAMFIRPENPYRSYDAWYDGQHWYHYQATTYSTYEYIGPYMSTLITGKWMQLAFTTDMNRRCLWVNGFPVAAWPFYRGDRKLSDAQELFQLGRQYAGIVAEVSDFRFYFEELTKDDLLSLRNEWIGFRKGCGDGERDEWEECDDGNRDNGDGCDSECNREDGYVCMGGNSTSIQPDKCVLGTYVINVDFEGYAEGDTAEAIFSDVTGQWSFSVEEGWADWDMLGTYLGTSLYDMSLGSSSLDSATCSEENQYCCDSTFGTMIGGLRMCGAGCELTSSFSDLPSHNYVRITVQLVLVDSWYRDWVYMYADDELRMEIYKYSTSVPVVKSEACLPRKNYGANRCSVNYCGGSSTDDLTTMDIYFYHNRSTLDVKFTNSLTSATSKALGFTYLDMEVGLSSDFIFQTEGAGILTIGEQYGSFNGSQGISLRNNPVPSYSAKSGSSYSHLLFPMNDVVASNAFAEFSFNYYRAPYYYSGFYLTLIRADRGAATDVFKYNLQACPVASIDDADLSSDCAAVKFYRICYDSNYEPNQYTWQSTSFCDERHYPSQGQWLRERVEIGDKFAFKYGDEEGYRPGMFYLQFGVYGDYYGNKRDVEVFIDDVKVGVPLVNPQDTDCPELRAIASPAGVEFKVGESSSLIAGSRTTGEWNVVQIDPATHNVMSSVQHFNDSAFSHFVNALSYGTLVMVAHSGPIDCSNSDACSTSLGILGMTSLTATPNSSESLSLAGIGFAGVGTGKMPFSVVLSSDDKSAEATSYIGCHARNTSVGENFHSKAKLTDELNVLNMTTYLSDSSSTGYIGCYVMGSESNLVSVGYAPYYTMTPGACSLACHDNGFVYARMYRYYCYCGDDYGNAYTVSSRTYPVSDTGEASEYYCYNLQYTWHSRCRGDYGQYCPYYTYGAWYRARSSEPFDWEDVVISCENARSSSYCQRAMDGSYSTDYRSENIVDNKNYSITMDMQAEYFVDSLRVQTISYILESYELLCAGEDMQYQSYGVQKDIDKTTDSVWITGIDAKGWKCRYLKLRLLENSGYYFRISELRINYFPSAMDKEKYDKFTTTYMRSYYELSRTPNYFYNAYENSILPVMDSKIMYSINNRTGAISAHYMRMDYELLRSYHVRIFARLMQFDSGWFDMSDIDNFMEVAHHMGEFPWNVRVNVRVLSGDNAGFVFEGTGCAMVDGSEIGNVTYGTTDYPETYGGLLFGYNENNVRLWAPSGVNGYIVNVNGGWGHSNLQSSKKAEVRVRVSRGSVPQYDTGWTHMQSQSSNPSMIQRDFPHNLGSLEYALVKVYYRVRGGVNDGYVFEAVGASQSDDDGGSYGGVVFGYTDSYVRIYLPNNTDSSQDNCADGYNGFSKTTGQNECRNCSTLGGYPCTHKDGYAVFIPNGFGGGSYTQRSHDVDVRIRIWTYEYNKADFVTEGIQLTSNGVAYAEKEHDVGSDIDKVVLVTKANVLPYNYYATGISASAGTDVRPRLYGGVIFAYDAENIRLWAPAQSLNNMWHAYGQSVSVGDGWGNGSTLIGSQETTVKALFYMGSRASGMDQVDTSMMSISVLNNNEIPDMVTNDASIVEDTYGEGYIVTTVTASDVDGTEITEFTIIRGNVDDAFKIDENGQVMINNPLAIDYELHQNFSLQIAVSDGVLSEVGTLFISVLNMNDIPILWPPYNREVREGSSETTAVGDPLNATDTDISQAILYYMLPAGNMDNAFGVSACSGQIYVKNPDALDYEGITGYSFFNLSVLVTDDGENAGNATYIIPVTVLNRNDPPVWEENYLAMNVTENSPVGTLLYPNLNHWCTDPDYGDLLSYEILSISSTGFEPNFDNVDSEEGVVVLNTDFKVDNITGNVTVGTSDLNYEAEISYSLYIRCTDYNLMEEQDPPNLYVEKSIFVIVEDDNDPPQFDSTTLSQFLYEQSSMNTLLVNTPVIATDEDVDDTLEYSIVNTSQYAQLFGIDSSTGEIYQSTDEYLDYEEVQFIQLTVMATDHGILTKNRTVDPRSTLAVVNVTIGDVNEPPVFINSTFRMNESTVNGDVNIGDIVHTVYGTDPDILSNQDLTFTITGADVLGAEVLFSVDNNGMLSGDLLIANTVSFEEYQNFILYFEVQDNGADPSNPESSFGLKANGHVSVTVDDVNDYPVLDCSTTSSSCSFTIDENSQSGTFVGNIAAFDEDGEPLTWSLVNPSVSFGKRFALDSVTGDVTVSLDGDVAIDFEATDTYAFTVRVSDGSTKINGPGYDEATYVIHISDVPESPYYTGNDILEFGISEGATPGALVGSPLANYYADQDADTVLTFSAASEIVVHPGNGNPAYTRTTIFTIDSSMGQIRVGQTPSSASLAEDDLVFVNFSVTDGIFIVNDTVEVEILDNNFPPVFPNATCNTTENRVGPYQICRLNATDPDGDGIIYSIGASAVFQVSSDGWLSLMSGQSLNFEAQSVYTISVVAADTAKYSQADSAIVTVSVQDLNDNPVVRSYVFSIPEDQNVGTLRSETSMTFSDEDMDALTCTTFGDESDIFSAHEVNSGNWSGGVVAQLNNGETVSIDDVNITTDNPLEFVYVTVGYDPLVSAESLVSNIAITISDPGGNSLELSSWPDSWDSSSHGIYATAFDVLASNLTGQGSWLLSVTNTGLYGSGTVEYDLSVEFTFDGRDSLDVGANTLCYLGLLSALDYETETQLKIQLNVYDGSVTRVANVTVNVQDVNEAPTMPDYELYLDENSAAGTEAADISSATILTAEDVEGNDLAFSFISGNENGIFEIHTLQSSSPAQFVIAVASGATVDYESTARYDLVIAATEINTIEMYNATSSVVIYVNNINDVLVTSVENTERDVFNRSNAPLWTEGGNIVVIHGSDFGSKNSPEPVVVTYGPTGEEYTATDCVVTPGDNVEITCKTVAGVGIAHVWKVEVSSSGHSYVSTFISGITTRYYRPLLSAVVNNDLVGEDYRTSGGETIRLEGSQFGTEDSAVGSSTRHFAGYSTTQSYGSVFYLQDPMEEGMHKCRSALAFYVSVPGDTITLISDTCPSAGVITVTVQSKLATDKSNFNPTNVAKSPCSFERSDSDWSNVNELGRFMDYEKNIDDIFVPAAALVVSTTSASSSLVKSCSSDTVWRTYVSGKPRMYYSNFEVSTTVVNETSSSGGTSETFVSGGYALLATDCAFNTTDSVHCITPDGVGNGYRARYVVAGQLSDEMLNTSFLVNYHKPVVLSLNGSDPSLQLDTRGYTSSTPDVVYLRTLFSGTNSAYSSYGAGKTKYGAVNSSDQYVDGYYSSSCTVSVSLSGPDATGYWYCRESGVCRYEQVDLLTCYPVAGTGFNHLWRVEVGSQISGYASSSTSYKSPVISYMNPDQWPFSDTAGGDTIIIVGDQFGPVSSSISTTAPHGSVEAYYGSDLQFSTGMLFNTRSGSCSVTSAHEEITCIVGTGTGRNHSWQLQVGGQYSNEYGASSSYAQPILVDFAVYNGSSASSIPQDVYSFSTEGNQYVEIQGRNFGPTYDEGAYNAPILATARYVGDSDATYVWEYQNCTVVEAHITLVCLTSVGVGAELKWNIMVDNQTNTVPTTSYAPPSLTSVSGVGFNISDGLDTRGGQYIDIIGDNFGPDLSFVERVSFGPTGGEYLLYDPQSKKYNCDFLVPHKSFRCLVPAGFGKDHFVTIRVAGQKTSDASGSNYLLSYKRPVISFVSPLNGTSQGGYTIKIFGSNFGPSSGAVLSFWGTSYSSYPLTYLSHEEMEFIVPTGQGIGKTIMVGHYSSWCDDDCQQYSLPFNFSYRAPQVDRLIFTDSYVSGFSNLTLYGVVRSSVPSEDGGSFGADTSVTYFDYYEFVNTVWIFPYNCTYDYIDYVLSDIYANFDLSNFEGDSTQVKICGINTDLGNFWSHNNINCLTAGTNGTVVVATFDLTTGLYQRSEKFLFKEKSPVIYTPLDITSPFPEGEKYPTTGGFEVTVTGMYFGSLTTVGARPDGVDVLLYLEGYMDYVKCLDLVVVSATNDDDESTLSCTIPPGQGKNVAIIVRKGGEGSKLMSDYIVGDDCDACVSFDPPVIDSFTVPSQSRRLSGSSFPVYSMTTGIESLVFYGSNFGLPGGVVVKVADTVLVEDTDAHSPFNITVALGEGVGRNLQLSVQVANHEPVTVTSNGSPFLVHYYPPDVAVVSKMMLHTEGNENLVLSGLNFGRATSFTSTTSSYASDVEYSSLSRGKKFDRHIFLLNSAGLSRQSDDEYQNRLLQSSSDTEVILQGVDSNIYTGYVELDGAREELTAWNHTTIVITTSEAAGGKNRSLVVTAGDQVDTVIGIDYFAPTITSISIDHAPTSGLTKENEKIQIVLSGSDFGSPIAYRYVTFGNTVISDDDLNTTHTTCELFVPAGQGVDVPITITVEDQTSNTVYFDYDPPLAVELTPTIGDTDACNQWESLQNYISRLDTNPSADRVCTDKQYITLSGYSFGKTAMKIVVDNLICETDSSGNVISSSWNCFDCALDSSTQENVCYQSDREIVFWAPQAYGRNLSVELYVDGRRDNSSETLTYSFYPPEITVSSPGSNSQGYGYMDAMGDSLTIQGENLGGTASWVSINFTGKDTAGYYTQLECANAKWNDGSFSVGNGFPYLTCDMPADIVGAKNMTIHVADQTVEVPVRRIVDNSLFISTCKASYDSSNQQTIYYGLRYYEEHCIECPVGALCKPEEYEVDPVSDEAFWLTYYDVDSQDAAEQCSKARRPPQSNREKCPVYEGCFPPEACTGSNTCEEAYSYVLEDCIDERSKNAHKYNNNTCYTDHDCNKGDDICQWDQPEKCSFCNRVPGSSEPGTCTCTAAPKCSLCKVKEYYRIGGKCVKCPENVLVLIVLFATALLTFVVGAYYLNKYKFNLAFVAIGFDYFQVLAVFASSDIVWPPLVIKMFSISLFFSFDINITAPECAFPDVSYETKWFGTMFLPIMGGVVLFMMFLLKAVHKYVWRNKRGWTALTKHGNQLMAMFVIMLYYLYLPLLRKALEIVNCNPADPDDGHLYTEWTSINCPAGVCRCWEKPSDPQMQLLPFAALSLLVYAIGYPIYVTYIIMHHKELIKEDQLLRAAGTGDTRSTNPLAYDIRKKFHKLYYHFKPGKVYWMIYVLIRKFWIAVAALLFRSNPTFQMSFILLVIFVCYILQVQHRPFMSTVEREGELERHRAKVDEALKAQENGEKMDATMTMHLKIQRIMDTVEKKDEVLMKRLEGQRSGAKTLNSVTTEDLKNFFWDFNNVELYLLGCAIFVCISGIMFESDSYSTGNTLRYHLLLLTFLVMLVIASSILYFGVVFVSEVMTTLGYDTTGMFEMFMSKEYKKSKSEAGVAQLELRKMDSNENPMMQGSSETDEVKTRKAMEMAALQDENEMLMKQIADLKKRDQMQRMSSFGTTAQIQTQKKLKKKSTFETKSSGGSFNFDDKDDSKL